MKCCECGAILPEEIEPGTGVYCNECGTGQHVTDGGEDYAELRMKLLGRPDPDVMALSCLYAEAYALTVAAFDTDDPTAPTPEPIRERYRAIADTLVERTGPRFPTCPECGEPALSRAQAATTRVECVACGAEPEGEVADEWDRQDRRVWGERGHGGRVQ